MNTARKATIQTTTAFPGDCCHTLLVGGVAQVLQETEALTASEKQWEHTILPQKISARCPHACGQSKQTLCRHPKPHDPAFSFPSLHMVPAGHLASSSFRRDCPSPRPSHFEGMEMEVLHSLGCASRSATTLHLFRTGYSSCVIPQSETSCP